jgi:hypothetical protein
MKSQRLLGHKTTYENIVVMINSKNELADLHNMGRASTPA